MSNEGAALVHVTFGDSAGGSLMKAVEALGGNREQVLFLADDLGYGPIKPADPRPRMEWAVEELGWDLEDATRFSSHDDAFWNRLKSLSSEIIAWISRRCVKEYCGL